MHGNTDVDNHAGAGTTRGRTALVTGAGSGIGRAVARRLAGDGWNVAVSARTARDLTTLAAEAPGRIHAFPLDVTDAEAVLETVARIEDAPAPLDLAVLNAGSYARDSATQFDAAAFRATVEVNSSTVTADRHSRKLGVIGARFEGTNTSACMRSIEVGARRSEKPM